MRQNPIALIFALTLISSAIAPAAEANRRMRHDNRQTRQSARIQQGVKSGELTKAEAKRLQRQQRGIASMENRAEADGTVTAKEKAQIERAQGRASRNIYRQKHDSQDRH